MSQETGGVTSNSGEGPVPSLPMSLFAERYARACEGLNVRARPEIGDAFTRPEVAAPEEGKDPLDQPPAWSPPSRLVLQGHSNSLFRDRLLAGDVEALVSALIECEMGLEEIDLACNELGDKGAMVLGRLLAPSGDGASGQLAPLGGLNIRCNGVGPDGCFELCEALKDNKTLRSLNLRGNPLGNDGGMSVAKMLHVNSSIQSVDLDDSEIGADVVIALATVLAANSTIREISLSNPQAFSLHNESTFALGKMLRVNHSLHTLRLGKVGA